MKKTKSIILDGLIEDQLLEAKHFFGLTEDQAFSEIEFTSEEEEKYRELFKEIDSL